MPDTLATNSLGNMLRAAMIGVLTIDELAKYLKIAKSTLYKLAQEGSIPGQKVGKHWRFHKDAVDEWLRERNPRKPSTERKT